MEIERKYLLDQKPDLAGLKHVVMQQHYLSVDPVLRIRKAGEKHIFTYKSGMGMVRQEEEFEISAEDFEKLVRKRIGNGVYKVRYYLLLDAYGIIGLNSKDSTDKGFLKLSPILFSPQMRLMIDLRRKHAQNEDLSAKRSAACNSGSTVSDVVPSRLLQRQSAEHTPDVDLHRSTVRYSKDVSLACAA